MSPNKTWEGFIGSAILTIIFSFFFPLLLSNNLWYICPADNLYLLPFPPALHCEPHNVFVENMSLLLPFVGEIIIKPIQLHGLAYGLFHFSYFILHYSFLLLNLSLFTLFFMIL